jgi:chromosome segregation ATPase
VIYTGYEGMSQDELVRLIENGDDKLANELLARFLILLEDMNECEEYIKNLKNIIKNQKEKLKSGEFAELKHDLENAEWRVNQAERQIADDSKEIAKLKKLCLKLNSEKAELIKKTADVPAFW